MGDIFRGNTVWEEKDINCFLAHWGATDPAIHLLAWGQPQFPNHRGSNEVPQPHNPVCFWWAEAFLAHHPWQSNHPHGVPDHSKTTRPVIEKRGGNTEQQAVKKPVKTKSTGVYWHRYTGREAKEGLIERWTEKRYKTSRPGCRGAF